MAVKILYLLDSNSGIFTDKEHEDSNFGEAQGMFKEDGTLIDAWSNNDASWRPEYFNPMMVGLGYNVLDADNAPKKLLKQMKKTFIEYWEY